MKPDTTPLDFQTAPYEALCGCVGAPLPMGLNYLWPEGKPNHEATERLIRDSAGNRTVMVNCPKCKGTGIMPVKGSKS